MRILKAKYLPSRPFLQLTVAVTGCGVGDVTPCLEGSFCVRFSSLIKAEGGEFPLVPHGHVLFSTVFHCEGETHVLGANAVAQPRPAAAMQAVDRTHPHSGRRDLTSASCPLTSTGMPAPLRYIKSRIDIKEEYVCAILKE